MTEQPVPALRQSATLFAALDGSGALGDAGLGFRALFEAWQGALTTDAAGDSDAASESYAAGGIVDTDAAAIDVASMSDDGLVRVTTAIAELERRLVRLKLRCASAVARRSTGDSRHEGLAGERGFSTPQRFLAATTGSSTAEAAKLIAVAAATQPPETFGPSPRPARYACVADAIASGTLSVEAAHRISTFLDSVRGTVASERLIWAEGVLVERAGAVGLDGLGRYLKHLSGELDPAGVRLHEVELHERRSLRWWEDRLGLIHLSGCFDPVTAAPIKVALEALVSADLHAARDAKSRLAAAHSGAQRDDPADACLTTADRSVAIPIAEMADLSDLTTAAADASTSFESADAAQATRTAVASDPGPAAAGFAPDAADRALVDARTIEQMAADALADIARLATAATDAPPALSNAAVVTRIDLESLKNELGAATIDGIDQPVSATSARMIASTSAVIPMVCGGDGEVLDLGRRRRLFTKAQRIALAERDGGCAHPDCARPVAHTQAHHIRWWDAHDGPSDLENGVLLCAFHHWMIHHDGWRVFVRDGRVWFVPPAHLDAAQRPRPGRRSPHLELRSALAA